MTQTQTLFLEALKASLNKDTVQWDTPLPAEQWQALFRLAQEHHVLPMIFEAVCRCPAAQEADPGYFSALRQQVFRIITVQTQKTSEFLALYRHLAGAGLHPITVKGIVCRALYPKPDSRTSSDEDLLIRPEEYAACHGAMTAFGMTVKDGTDSPERAFEVPYRKEGSPLFIELHKQLFAPDSQAYGHLNRYFDNCRTTEMTLDGVTLRTLAPTEHLFYLICHALKHFLHSGFGIRQVCDICLFANAYGPSLDWAQLLVWCREIRAERFTAAMLQIGRKHLTFSPEKACCPPEWRQISTDESAMLQDLLGSGVFGSATLSRRHSSAITLSAAAGQPAGGVKAALFPPVKSLRAKYPYLERYPILLPIAWGSRMAGYAREVFANKTSSASEAVRLGGQRVALLKEYGLVD